MVVELYMPIPQQSPLLELLLVFRFDIDINGESVIDRPTAGPLEELLFDVLIVSIFKFLLPVLEYPISKPAADAVP